MSTQGFYSSLPQPVYKIGDTWESVSEYPRWYLRWLWDVGDWLHEAAYWHARKEVVRYRFISEQGAMERIDESS